MSHYGPPNRYRLADPSLTRRQQKLLTTRTTKRLNRAKARGLSISVETFAVAHVFGALKLPALGREGAESVPPGSPAAALGRRPWRHGPLARGDVRSSLSVLRTSGITDARVRSPPRALTYGCPDTQPRLIVSA